MLNLDEIQMRLLREVADLHKTPEGAYNIRSNSESAGRASTANIEIVSKEDVSGLDITIKPGTPVEELRPYVGLVDLILLMSVEPGFGGQSYIPSSTQKVMDLRKMIDESGSHAKIEIDGGVSPKNAEEILRAGVDVVVAGSAVFKNSISENVKSFYEIFERVESGDRT